MQCQGQRQTRGTSGVIYSSIATNLLWIFKLTLAQYLLIQWRMLHSKGSVNKSSAVAEMDDHLATIGMGTIVLLHTPQSTFLPFATMNCYVINKCWITQKISDLVQAYYFSLLAPVMTYIHIQLSNWCITTVNTEWTGQCINNIPHSLNIQQEEKTMRTFLTVTLEISFACVYH